MLKTINLKKVYPNGEEALKGINLEIPNGQVVALIGPSGAGKSTFIRTINRLVGPSSGNVYFANEKNDITSLKKSKLRKGKKTNWNDFPGICLSRKIKCNGKCPFR